MQEIDSSELSLLSRYLVRVKQDRPGDIITQEDASHISLNKLSGDNYEVSIAEEEESDYEELSDYDDLEDDNIIPAYGQYSSGDVNSFMVNVVSHGTRIGETYITLIIKFTLDSVINLHPLNERLLYVEFCDPKTGEVLVKLEQDHFDTDNSAVWFSERMLSNTDDWESKEYLEGKLVWGVLWARKIPESTNSESETENVQG